MPSTTRSASPATGQAALWTANGAEGANAWIPYVLEGLRIAGWLLVALLLAGN